MRESSNVFETKGEREAARKEGGRVREGGEGGEKGREGEIASTTNQDKSFSIKLRESN